MQVGRETDTEFLLSDSVRWFSLKFCFLVLIIIKL
jgi:hypothetical protein